MKNNIKFGLCGVAALALASSVYATPQNAVRFSTDGSTWTTPVTDGSASDVEALLTGTSGTSDGQITTLINLGSFHLVVTTSYTYPAVGSLGSPIMDLHVGGATLGTGTLYVQFSSTGFTPVPSGPLTTTIAPNQPGVTETETTFIGATDALFDTGGATFGPIGGSDTVGASSQGVVPSGVNPYTITIQDKFVSSGAGLSLSTDDRISVPDGGNTLMLLGSALSVLGLGVFRKSRKA
jgi:hypothetical protein